ncbi:hypothetical protein EON83_13920 [bacterium]|nr:MAG: hypothetical protein EON83_13920 [bacterium]
MQRTCSSQLGKVIGLMALALFAANARPVLAFPADAPDTSINAYLKAFVRSEGEDSFIKGKQDGGRTGFWQEIEQVEGVEDANDRTNGAYKTQVIALLNGFVKAHGNNWANNDFNDDIAWAVIAYVRGYQATGDKKFLKIAQSNYDMMFARAWDPVKGALFWKTNNASYNSCIECPAGIAACLLSKELKDSSYETRARNLYNWNKANLFDAKTGAVLDSINVDGKMNKWSSTYNQGTFVALANFLGETATAKLAADYTMNQMGDRNASGFKIMPQYGAGGGDLAGFHSIGLRWISRFMKEHKLEATYLPWLQANADAAWNMRRTADNLSWCRWLEPTPDGVLHSWDCISSVVALQVVPATDEKPKV